MAFYFLCGFDANLGVGNFTGVIFVTANNRMCYWDEFGQHLKVKVNKLEKITKIRNHVNQISSRLGEWNKVIFSDNILHSAKMLRL